MKCLLKKCEIALENDVCMNAIIPENREAFKKMLITGKNFQSLKSAFFLSAIAIASTWLDWKVKCFLFAFLQMSKRAHYCLLALLKR